jgi:hypothetical protein
MIATIGARLRSSCCSRDGETMRYVTHQFAHMETLERARRWLVHAGFDPSQIGVMADGVPRIAVKVSGGQAVEAELIIDAAELTDPIGPPGFWQLPSLERESSRRAIEHKSLPEEFQARTFVVGYHAPNERPEDAGITLEAMQEAFLSWGDD